MRHLAHVTYHQGHALVVLQLAHSLVVRHIEEGLPVDLKDLVADHQSGPVRHTVLVHAGHKYPQAVLHSAANHQAQRLARFDEQLHTTYPEGVKMYFYSWEKDEESNNEHQRFFSTINTNLS